MNFDSSASNWRSLYKDYIVKLIYFIYTQIKEDFVALSHFILMTKDIVKKNPKEIPKL